MLQIARERGVTVIGTAGAANQEYLRDLGAVATTYGEGWVERVRRLGEVHAALDLAGSGVIRELVELTGSPSGSSASPIWGRPSSASGSPVWPEACRRRSPRPST